MLLEPPTGPLVLGIGLVDFNHLVGPKIEFSDGAIFEDDEISKILPFLALPDGAHMTTEDYSYFHLVPSPSFSPSSLSTPLPSSSISASTTKTKSIPIPTATTTIFGISCNRQIKSSELIARDTEVVTRSTVQKAVVVLASKPVFGPIRDKLGVVTRALFNQRDFRETDILVAFRESLETSLRTQLTESGLYMGTRELVHTFRSRTLILLKALMLQKRIMFYGHPVEKLCTYQYSLISLIPGLLQTLDDCGSPPLASRAPTLERPTSLRTSDRKSLLAYLGLPLDIFGKEAFFQPYLPLQQMDLVKETKSWLCGSTNSILTQQKEIDLLINIETNTFEFRDPKLERSAGLTPADRLWMDEVVKDVNEGWNESDPTRPTGMHFKGSDDYLRTKFEEYVSSALASVKYADFLGKGEKQNVLITDTSGGSDGNAIADFNPLWISEFRQTNAFEVWNRITDPLLFDIVEARHPCAAKPNVVTDIGLRLQEGLQDLKLEQQLAPTREAISRTIATGSTNFFKAMEGVRGRWATQRSGSVGSLHDDSSSTSSGTPVEITKADAEVTTPADSNSRPASVSQPPAAAPPVASAIRPLSVTAAQAAGEAKATLGAWGSGIGSFLSQRAARLSLPRTISSGSADNSRSSSPSQNSSPAGTPQNGSPAGSMMFGRALLLSANVKPPEGGGDVKRDSRDVPAVHVDVSVNDLGDGRRSSPISPGIRVPLRPRSPRSPNSPHSRPATPDVGEVPFKPGMAL
ncbi:hypothetical protein BD410DRAFT_730247 [Rickenella mellea]|uniref:UDENN domain-containing protein n=1 Tax=Rickenella mellea TaxID=50990 RepID=A0A4Y7PPC5_9AGAM|nr:hypothetical protein BD410DRAFT_730247 [Rickenella mellea]